MPFLWQLFILICLRQGAPDAFVFGVRNQAICSSLALLFFNVEGELSSIKYLEPPLPAGYLLKGDCDQ
jgi:hypothetical protein